MSKCIGIMDRNTKATATVPNLPIGDSARFIECWFWNFGTAYNAHISIVEYGNYNPLYNIDSRYGIGVVNGKLKGFCCGTGFTSPIVCPEGWNHVGFGYDVNYFYLYLNGQIVYTSKPVTKVYKSTLTDLYINRTPQWWGSFNGYVDNVRVYNRCISLAEFNKSYRVTSGLVVAYNFNGDDGTTMYDTLGNYNGIYKGVFLIEKEGVDFEKYIFETAKEDRFDYNNSLIGKPSIDNYDTLVNRNLDVFIPYISDGDTILKIL